MRACVSQLLRLNIRCALIIICKLYLIEKRKEGNNISKKKKIEPNT